VMLESPEVDALVMSFVPLTPAMLTTPDEIAKTGSLVERLPKLFAAAKKPIVVNIDSGPLYEPMVRALRAAGVPVFRSADQAVRALGRYMCQRLRIQQGRIATMDAANVVAAHVPGKITQPA